MLKLIPILIIFLFYFNSIAQVIIKEEVDLNFSGDSPESVTLPATTSYGKVWGSINNHAHNPFEPQATMKAIRIVAGGQTKLVGENCQGWIWPTSWAIDNVPSGTPVTVTVYAACDGSLPVEAEQTWYTTTSNPNIFSVHFKRTAQSWEWVATDVRYSTQTPPGNCTNAGGNYCDDAGWVQVPEVKLVSYPNSNVISDYCAKSPNTIASFSPALDHKTNLIDLNESNVIGCYNQILQTWQFNLDQDVKIYYQIGICSTNVSNKNLTYINSESDINTTIIPSNRCDDAIKSFEAHKHYNWDAATQTCGLGIPYGGYIIKEVILEHENQHKVNYEEFMNNYRFIWETNINTYRAICSTYNDIFEARRGGFNMFWNAFFGVNESSQYYAKFNSEYNKLNGLSPQRKELKCLNEQRTNRKKEVQNLINKYIKKLKDHCGMN